MYKRIIAIVLSVLLGVQGVPVQAQAVQKNESTVQNGNEGKVQPQRKTAPAGEKDSDGDGITDSGFVYAASAKTETATIVGYTGNATNLSIPAAVSTVIAGVAVNYTVISIGSGAFRAKSGVTSVTIPKGVMTIADYAFYGCMQLAKIVIPETVSSIGPQALADCVVLSSITVTPGNSHYRVIDNSLFQYTLGLDGLYGYTLLQYPVGKPGSSYTAPTEASLNGRMIGIGPGAFLGSTELSKITLPDTVTFIGDGAFKGCRALSDLKIPEAVTNIGDSAFYGCIALKELLLPKGITSLGSNAFSGCVQIKEMNIPEKVTYIGQGIFQNCISLEEVTIPSGVTMIGNNAFSGCTALIKVVAPTSVLSVGYNAFAGCNNLTLYCHTGSAVANYAKSNNIKMIFTYTVSFYDGGKLLSKQEVMAGGSGVPPTIAEREGYELSWSTSYTTVTGDVTTSAIWTRVYTVTFRDGYLGKTEAVKTPIGVSAKAPEWTMPNYKLSWDRDFDVINGDLTVNAIWTNRKNGFIITENTKKPADVGTELTEGNMVYRVTTADPSGPRVQFVSNTDETAAFLTIPGSIIVDEVSYAVTTIADTALKGKSELMSVSIGKNIAIIGEQAFYGCKKLKSVKIFSTKITTIRSRAFGAIHTRAVIRVPRKKFKTYKRMLTKSRIGSKVSVRML
ncbi:MAG: leucine-rich repeat protein [Lachnospiraceae bacterium]